MTPRLLQDLGIQGNDYEREARAKRFLFGLRMCLCDQDCPRLA